MVDDQWNVGTTAAITDSWWNCTIRSALAHSSVVDRRGGYSFANRVSRLWCLRLSPVCTWANRHAAFTCAVEQFWRFQVSPWHSFQCDAMPTILRSAVIFSTTLPKRSYWTRLRALSSQISASSTKVRSTLILTHLISKTRGFFLN